MIWCILLLGLILRLIGLNQSLWLDEAINILATQNYSLLGMISDYAKADFHPPGYFIILWFWTKLFGYGEIAVRIPSVIFGSLTIWFSYLIGKKLVFRELGFLVALLIAINPLHIYYSQEARMYAMATLAVSINFFLLIKLIKKEKLSMLFLILSNLLVLASDYVAYFIFPSQLIFLLIFKKEFLKKWFLALISATALGIWWIPVFLSQLDVGSIASERLPSWKLIVGAFDPKAIPLTLIKFIIGRISYPEKAIYALVMLPISTLFLYLIWRGVKFMKSMERNLILSWLFIPIILASIISFAVPIYSYFRLLFVLIPFIILVGLGITSFKSKLRYVFLTAVLAVQLFSTLIYLLNPSFQRDDWKGVVDFLKPKKEVAVLFESSGTLPPFDYYAKGEINAKGALKDFPASDINDIAQLENILQGTKEVYLIEYLVDISDPQRLVQKRLDQLNYKEQKIHNFAGVGFVYEYIKE